MHDCNTSTILLHRICHPEQLARIVDAVKLQHFGDNRHLLRHMHCKYAWIVWEIARWGFVMHILHGIGMVWYEACALQVHGVQNVPGTLTTAVSMFVGENRPTARRQWTPVIARGCNHWRWQRSLLSAQCGSVLISSLASVSSSVQVQSTTRGVRRSVVFE